VRVLTTHRRDAAAATLALLAVASLGLVAVAAAVSMRDALRTVLAGAALLGYAYFAWRAMELLQGRGSARPERPAWRRHFLHEKGDRPTRPSRSEERGFTRLTASWSRPTRFGRITHPTTRRE
jgi:hypothetical protein